MPTNNSKTVFDKCSKLTLVVIDVEVKTQSQLLTSVYYEEVYSNIYALLKIAFSMPSSLPTRYRFFKREE